MINFQLLDYQAILDKFGHSREKRKHLLLGNGFSIACDPIFSYGRLYDAAVAAGLSKRAQQIFDHLGTSNFEGAMRLLDESHLVAEIYGLIPPGKSAMRDDVEIIKHTLIDAVAKSHLAHTGLLSDEKKASALRFMEPYHNIFTTNYDLLAYWVSLSHHSGRSPWGDGFRHDQDAPEEPYVVFSERLGSDPGMFYVHGGLHLNVSHGELRKHSWAKSGRPLTELIKQSLEKGDYPLFIAEGAADKKLEQIQRTGYLWYCLDKLSKVQNALVVFGHTLGSSDQHIADVIAGNIDLPCLAIGLFGNPDSVENCAIRDGAARMQIKRRERIKRKGKALEVLYFNSESASVWN